MSRAGVGAEPAGAGLTLLDGLRWHGTPVPGDRAHALLAALALDPLRAVADARLVEEVWGPDDAPANPTKALQVLVSRTRAATAAEVVVRDAHGYRLGEPDVDVTRLREHARSARAALAEGRTETAREEARAALQVPVRSSGVDDGPVARLLSAARDDVRRARAVLGTALSVLGKHDEALVELEPAVADDPGDEHLLEALLRSTASVRGVSAALERYERHRVRLRDALGTDPGPGLRALHAELLAQDRPVREGLHYDPSRMIGRDADVAALAEMIRTSRITSIVGAGGLGKTRLAHVMGRLAEQPVVHFVELAGVTSPDGVAVEVGSLLGVRESLAGRRLQGAAQRHDLHARIVERVGAAPTLLILDNCEHVVEAVADLVAVLVARTAQLTVLTTTRAPLGLASERVYPLSQLGRADAVELFRERATAARPGVRLDDERVGLLVERLDGLPLAVELAAAKVRVMSVEEIERRLENRFALLRGGSRDAPERHQTLLAVIDWSWNLLTADERLALRRLSVFRDGFSLAAAADVVAAEDPVGLVTRLVDQSLVSVHEGDVLRYRLLETVREFGRMQLVDAGDDRETDSRLRRWAVRFADDASVRLFGPGQVAVMQEVRVEEGNLVDVLRRGLADADAVPVLRLTAALVAFWMVEGNHLKVVNIARSVEDVVVGVPVPADAEDALRMVLGALVTHTMIFTGTPSRGALDRLAALGPGDGEPRVRALTEVVLAVVDVERFGQLGVLDRLCADPEPAVARLALQWKSQALENAGDVDGAIVAATRAVELCDDDDEGPWTRALLMSQLAGLASQAGDNEAARDHVRVSLPVMEALGAVEDTAQLKSLLVLSDIEAGRLDEAEGLLAEIAEEAGSQSILGGAIVSLCGRAEIALARGQVDRGLALYVDAVHTLRSRGLPGVAVPGGFEPWVLYPEAGALAAHARHDAEAGAALRDDLLARVDVLLDGGHPFLDYPITGAAVFAVALWEATRPGVGATASGRAVRLLVLADRFAYSRMLPSLSWSHAAALAERLHPGLLESFRAEVAHRDAVELRDDVRRLLAELG